ncbi:MAG: hypothetical protein K9K79_05335 [Desulfohalobiaceae bacterium]|nr:hypothetical protein [Desulfohalobiaceae bacterium]
MQKSRPSCLAGLDRLQVLYNPSTVTLKFNESQDSEGAGHGGKEYHVEGNHPDKQKGIII